jgi:hypothetical protein
MKITVRFQYHEVYCFRNLIHLWINTAGNLDGIEHCNCGLPDFGEPVQKEVSLENIRKIHIFLEENLFELGWTSPLSNRPDLWKIRSDAIEDLERILESKRP